MLPYTVLMGVSALVIWLLLINWAKKYHRVTVFAHENALRYRSGALLGSLAVGSYRLRSDREEIRRLDMRLQYQTLSGQEMLTADRAQIRVSLVVSFRGEDPLLALHETQDWQSALHLELQLALREQIQALPLDGLLGDLPGVGKRIQEIAEPAVKRLGLQLEEVRIRDVMLPGDLKRAYAQALRAQKEGQAALEKARGEQAALRSLANAARMLEQNPALFNLRLLHTLENAPTSHTVVFQPWGEPQPKPTAEV